MTAEDGGMFTVGTTRNYEEVKFGIRNQIKPDYPKPLQVELRLSKSKLSKPTQ